MRKKDTMMYGNYNSPVLRNTDSDDSDSDEILPIGDFWPTPEEEEWTMVGRSHGSLRSANAIDSDRFYNSGDNLDHSGMRCTQLDYIDGNDNRFMSSEALSSNWKGEIQIYWWSTGDRPMTEPDVKSTVRKRLNVIAVEPRKMTDRPVPCPVTIVLTSQGEVFKSRCVGTHAGELSPEEPEIIPAGLAKEASMEGPSDKQDLQNNRNSHRSAGTKLTTVFVEKLRPRNQRPPDMVAEKASSDGTTNKQCRPVHRQSTETTVTDASTNFADKPKPTLSQRPAVAAEEAKTDGTIDVQCRSNDHDYTKTTVMNLPTDYVKIERPAPRQGQVDVAEEASTDDATNEQCIYEVLDNIKTTYGKLSMELLEIPQQLVTRGFLELAEEARNSGVEKISLFWWRKFHHKLPE